MIDRKREQQQSVVDIRVDQVERRERLSRNNV